MRGIASFLSLVKSNTVVEIRAEDVSATQPLLVKEWLRGQKTVKDAAVMLKIQNGLLERHTLVNYTSALAIKYPSKQQEIVDLLMEMFDDV